MRVVEALLFAATEPVSERDLAARLPDKAPVAAVMAALREHYAGRGINLVRAGSTWTFRTADDLAWLLSDKGRSSRRMPRAAMETLAIIAYHQPTTRADIEQIRGVTVGKGTLDLLLEAGWIRPRGRRRSPGRPTVFATTDAFLLHFGFETLADLPGLDELGAAGLFSSERSIPHLPSFGRAGEDDGDTDDVDENETTEIEDDATEHDDAEHNDAAFADNDERGAENGQPSQDGSVRGDVNKLTDGH